MAPLLQTDSLLEQLRHHAIAADELLPLLTRYQLIPQLIGGNIIDQAIASIEYTPEEAEQACLTAYQHWQLISPEQQAAWRSQHSLTPEQFEQLATRGLRLEKFKEMMWGHRLESYFLQQKHNLDRVIYSLIRHRDRELINELYFRIVEGEQSFAELARTYSIGSEAETGGRLGPFEMASLNADLAKLLYYAPVGEVQVPQQFGNCYAIVRVEQQIPAQLDETMRHHLLQQHFDRWFQDQLRQLPEPDQRWMGVATASEVATSQAA